MENKRRHARVKKRVSCALTSGGRRYTGVVLDVSPQGVFVQTSAKLEPGAIVELEMGIGTNQTVQMQAQVARAKLVPPELRSIAKGGLGLRIDLPPPEFYEFFANLTRTDLPGGEAQKAKTPAAPAAQAKKKKATRKRKLPPRMAPPAAKLGHRVRLSQVGGSRTRSVTVECSTVSDAERLAIRTVGNGWKVLKVDPA